MLPNPLAAAAAASPAAANGAQQPSPTPPLKPINDAKNVLAQPSDALRYDFSPHINRMIKEIDLLLAERIMEKRGTKKVQTVFCFGDVTEFLLPSQSIENYLLKILHGLAGYIFNQETYYVDHTVTLDDVLQSRLIIMLIYMDRYFASAPADCLHENNVHLLMATSLFLAHQCNDGVDRCEISQFLYISELALETDPSQARKQMLNKLCSMQQKLFFSIKTLVDQTSKEYQDYQERLLNWEASNQKAFTTFAARLYDSFAKKGLASDAKQLYGGFAAQASARQLTALGENTKVVVTGSVHPSPAHKRKKSSTTVGVAAAGGGVNPDPSKKENAVEQANVKRHKPLAVGPLSKLATATGARAATIAADTKAPGGSTTPPAEASPLSPVGVDPEARAKAEEALRLAVFMKEEVEREIYELGTSEDAELFEGSAAAAGAGLKLSMAAAGAGLKPRAAAAAQPVPVQQLLDQKESPAPTVEELKRQLPRRKPRMHEPTERPQKSKHLAKALDFAGGPDAASLTSADTAVPVSSKLLRPTAPANPGTGAGMFAKQPRPNILRKVPTNIGVSAAAAVALAPSK